MRSRKDVLNTLEELLSITDQFKGQMNAEDLRRWREISAQEADLRGSCGLEATTIDEEDEFVILKSPDGLYEARTTTYPQLPEYIRVVKKIDPGKKSGDGNLQEIVYWHFDEWQKEDADLSCIGAIFAVLNEVYRGEVLELRVRRKRELE